jgi:hypothetical protein
MQGNPLVLPFMDLTPTVYTIICSIIIDTNKEKNFLLKISLLIILTLHECIIKTTGSMVKMTEMREIGVYAFILETYPLDFILTLTHLNIVNVMDYAKISNLFSTSTPFFFFWPKADSNSLILKYCSAELQNLTVVSVVKRQVFSLCYAFLKHFIISNIWF